MPKIRGFKADLWTDEDFVELSPYARLLWMGMWNYCCDNGHIQDKSKQIKMRVLPTDDVNCAELLRELEAQGLIERADGWITVPNLTHHQSPHKRWWVTCEKPGCEFPKGATYGYSKPDSTVEQPLNTGESTVNNGGSTADVDVEVMVKGSDGDTPPTNTSAAKPPKKQSGKRPAKALPADWQPTAEHLTRCEQEGIDAAKQVAKFRAHAEANDRRQVNWNASFTQWLLGVPSWDRGNVTPIRGQASNDGGWFQPFTLPPAPPEVEDDPEAYDAWAEGRRQAWRNGERW
jgi:hypothetical protein